MLATCSLETLLRWIVVLGSMVGAARHGRKTYYPDVPKNLHHACSGASCRDHDGHRSMVKDHATAMETVHGLVVARGHGHRDGGADHGAHLCRSTGAWRRY